MDPVACTPLENLQGQYMIDMRMHLPNPRAKRSHKFTHTPDTDGKELDQILAEVATEKDHDCIKGFRPQGIENGLGATLSSLVKPMMHAVKYQQCVYTPRFKMWTGRKCKGYECFFQPMASPKTTTRAKTLTFTQKMAKMADDGILNASWCPTWWQYQMEQEDPPVNETESAISDNCLFAYSWTNLKDDMLPEEYADRGLFFNVAHIAKHMLRPSAAMQKRLKKVKKRLGWPKRTTPVLALHVRKGDACLAVNNEHNFYGRQCDPLSHYMPSVNLLAEKYKIKHIYLATDDDKVRENTKQYPQYTWMFEKKSLHSQRRTHVLKYLPIEKALRYQVIDPFEEGASYLTDLFLMSEAHALVGKFTSNLDRLVYSRMAAQGDCLRPFVSLDSGWCFDYGIANGDGDMGDFMC